MTTRVFFYGLYMDAALLRSLGLNPVVLGAARLDGYRLQIGERATLGSEPGAASYGFLIDLPDEEATALYARPEVQGYEPIRVMATRLADGSEHEASCYVLHEPELGTITNRAYSADLAALASRLGLPAECVSEIQQMAGSD